MTDTNESDVSRFSLLGGPLHQLGRRLRLVRDGPDTVRLGLAIGLFLWSVTMVLSLIDGRDMLLLETIGAHARLLVVIPLLFVGETALDPRFRGFMRMLERSGIVPSHCVPALNAELARVTRWKNSWAPELVCLALVASLLWLRPAIHVYGMAAIVGDSAEISDTWSGWWYATVCLTVMRFLFLRALWAFLLWLRCLWFVSRLPLKLIPTHSDGIGGLSNLEVVHTHFLPWILAISVALASSFAVDLNSGEMPFTAVYSAVGAILLLDAAWVFAPLLLFTPQLWRSRLKGMEEYMTFAERYAADFDNKWLRSKDSAEPLLGTPDIQSLADLTSCVTVVRDMRVVPMTVRLALYVAVAALLPLLPLILFKYPLTELMGEVIGRLTGL